MNLKTQKPPNIVWITTHDINPDLGCYAGIWPGAEFAHTPNLDHLAAEGLRFNCAFSTSPVCSPSRAAVITGMYPTASGLMHMRSRGVPPPEVRPFPEYMRRAGYYCTSTPLTDYQFHTPVTVFDDFGPQAHWRNRPNPDQPFFAMFHGMITHESQIYLDDAQFAASTRRLSDRERHDPARVILPPYFPDTPEFRLALAHYYDLVTAMDYTVGDILGELEEGGLADNTIVVFWSDHGRGFPREKRFAYEAGFRVPLIVRWPGAVQPGSQVNSPVSLVDLAATMLEAAGIPLPAHFHSQPLFDAQGQIAEARPYIFGHRDRMDEAEDTVRSVRDSRFHYLRNYHPDRSHMQHIDYAEKMATWKKLRELTFEEIQQRLMGNEPDLLTPVQRQFMGPVKPVEELYDISADPYEINNLAKRPEFAADLARMRAALEAWQAEFPDLGLVREQDLIQTWWPQGSMPVTSPPLVELAAGKVLATCHTEGAVIGWTKDPPGQVQASASGWQANFKNIIGNPDLGGRCWQIYSEPVPCTENQTLWFRAHRLGYRESIEIVFSTHSSDKES